MGYPLWDKTTCAAVCVGEHIQSFCGVELLDHKKGIHAALLATAKQHSSVVVEFTLTSKISSYLQYHLVLSVFLVTVIWVGMSWYLLVGLISIYLMTNNVEHLFKCLFGHLEILSPF